MSDGETRRLERQTWSDLIRAIGSRYAGATVNSFERHGTDADRQRQDAALNQVNEFCADMRHNIERGRNVVFSGTCGTGKDHLQVGMLRHAIAAGCFSIGWVSAVEMFGNLKDALSGSITAGEVIGDLYRPTLLVISDVLPINEPLSKYEAEMLFRLVDTRSRRQRPTWVSVNVETREEAVEKIGAKILSRLEQDSLVLRMQWCDYRRKAR